jgi:hypothetical protein
VPRGVLVEELGKRVHVGRVEGLVAAADDVGVLAHGLPPNPCSQWGLATNLSRSPNS